MHNIFPKIGEITSKYENLKSDFLKQRQEIQEKINQFIEADVNAECSNFWVQRVIISAKLHQNHQVRICMSLGVP